MVTPPVLVGFSAILLLSTAVHDVAFRTIPNWMPCGLLLIGVVVRMVDGGFVLGFLASSLIFFGAAACWRSGWLGGGDVKLLTACGLLVPVGQTVAFLLSTALAGGLLALLYLLLGQIVARPGTARPVDMWSRIVRVERYRVIRRGPLPYASAISSSALIVLFQG